MASTGDTMDTGEYLLKKKVHTHLKDVRTEMVTVDDLIDFADDSPQRAARHSHSALTEEPQRLRVKFVLNCST